MSHKTREQRQAEAKTRQARYNELTPQQRYVHATNPHRPGKCGRERARVLGGNPKLARLVSS